MINLSITGIKLKVECGKLAFRDVLSSYVVSELNDYDYLVNVELQSSIDIRIGRSSIEPRVDKDDGDYLLTEYYDEKGRCCAFNQIDTKNKTILIECLEASNLDDLIPFLAFEKLMWINDRFILHSSVVEKDGKCIAFIGRSGIGKSTQASLWEKYENARIICGDRSALDKDGNIYGIPFDGTARYYSNFNGKLGGIVVLRQGDREGLVRLNTRQAFSEMYAQITVNPWNKEFQKDAIDFVFNLVLKVPVYQLTCRICKEAVDIVRGEIYDK